jgi:RNA polymerase sigma factor (sigma-70 family)
MTHRDRDSELARRAVKGEAAAMAALVDGALPLVRGLAWRLAGNTEEADDLTQEAFAVALARIGRYRGEAAFSTWVCGIAANRYAEAVRQKARGRALREGPAPQADPAQVAMDEVSEAWLWRQVAELRPKDRDAIIARAAADSPAEAADALGITPNAFRVRLHRARLALRARLAERGPDLVEELSHGKQ